MYAVIFYPHQLVVQHGSCQLKILKKEFYTGSLAWKMTVQGGTNAKPAENPPVMYFTLLIFVCSWTF